MWLNAQPYQRLSVMFKYKITWRSSEELHLFHVALNTIIAYKFTVTF